MTKAAKSKRKKTATARPGLYENIHRAQQRAAHGGRPVRKKNTKGAPTAAAFKKAAKTRKKTKTKAKRKVKRRRKKTAKKS